MNHFNRLKESHSSFMKRTDKSNNEHIKAIKEEKEETVTNMVGSSIGKQEKPSIYFKDLVKKIEKKPDTLQLPKFKKEKKINPNKNNIVLIL